MTSTSFSSRQSIRMLITLLIAILLAFIASQIAIREQIAQAQDQTSQPLLIVVRDGVGNPLQGLSLDILLTGPPHQPYDSCVTDAVGHCRLIIPPGAYLVQFSLGWRGRSFIPAEEQNGGAFEDAGLGGFGIYLEPSTEEQIVTFVVGQQDNQLVPLWDLSRDPSAPPQPFSPEDPLHPEKGLEGIDLGPLAPANETTSEAEIPADESAQVLISEFPLDAPTAAPQAAPIQSAPVSTPEPSQRSLPSNAFGTALIGLIAVLLLIGVITLFRTQLQNRAGKTSR